MMTRPEQQRTFAIVRTGSTPRHSAPRQILVWSPDTMMQEPARTHLKRDQHFSNASGARRFLSPH